MGLCWKLFLNVQHFYFWETTLIPKCLAIGSTGPGDRDPGAWAITHCLSGHLLVGSCIGSRAGIWTMCCSMGWGHLKLHLKCFTKCPPHPQWTHIKYKIFKHSYLKSTNYRLLGQAFGTAAELAAWEHSHAMVEYLATRLLIELPASALPGRQQVTAQAPERLLPLWRPRWTSGSSLIQPWLL